MCDVMAASLIKPANNDTLLVRARTDWKVNGAAHVRLNNVFMAHVNIQMMLSLLICFLMKSSQL